jgi:hypothetical protein
MTDPYDRDPVVERDRIVETERGYGAGTIIGAIVVALIVIAAVWFLVSGNVGTSGTNSGSNSGGSGTGGGAVPSVTVPSAPALPGASASTP